MDLFNTHSLAMGTEFQDQLLQIKEGFLVSGPLTHLDITLPIVLCLNTLTIITDLIDDLEFNDTSLLEDGTADIFLDSQFDFETLGMWFGPDEASID